MDAVLNIYKQHGETPLQATARYARAHPEVKGARMTYAGRLDPMAEGVLVVLVGEKNKERDVYTGLDKEYEFDFVLGVETDTFDILGLVTRSSDTVPENADLDTALKRYEGTISQAYPPYSSKVVNGTPLFELARKGLLGSIELPRHEVTAHSIELVSTRSVSRDALRAMIIDSVGKVVGDFRQDAIIRAWEDFFSHTQRTEFTIYSARLSCGSGFYVRQLVADVGRDIGTGALTTRIVRTRVGEYHLKDSLRGES